jgi:3-phosphoshikimate 1-carboxyvinyltransferase
MLIAPYLPNGLKINLTTALTSKPYVLQTAQLMERFGVVASVNEQEITIPKGTYKPQQLTIEPDWSAFGYVASCILITNLSCEMPYLQHSTLQGDFGIVPFFQQLGLEVEFLENSSKLTKKPNFILPRELEIDFTEMPDQAQTLVVLCAALGVGLKANGLHTLRHKETDRISALQNELAKFKVSFSENAQGTFELEGKIEPWQGTISLKTYEDHRMAMAFSPLAAFGNLDFDEPSVVKKSFPHFWTELNKLGYRYI